MQVSRLGSSLVVCRVYGFAFRDATCRYLKSGLHKEPYPKGPDTYFGASGIDIYGASKVGENILVTTDQMSTKGLLHQDQVENHLFSSCESRFFGG